jgi:hypothetical protein
MFLKESDPEKPIVFLHVPRTAGTSFRWAAASQYSNEQVCLVHPGYYTEEEAILRQQEFKFITGHLSMDNTVISNLLGDFNLLTIVREPIHKFLSFYHYVKHTPHAIEHEQVKNLSLADAIMDPDFVAHNHLCKYLGGGDSETMYQTAYNHIENTFTLFGIQEFYPEFFAIMQRRFNWRGLVIKQEEHLSGVPAVQDLSKELSKKLVEHNQLDADLYGFACRIYEQRRLKWLR